MKEGLTSKVLLKINCFHAKHFDMSHNNYFICPYGEIIFFSLLLCHSRKSTGVKK